MAVATGSYKRGERSEKGEAGKDMERDEGYPTYVQYHAGFSRGPAKFPELVGSDKISLSAGLPCCGIMWDDLAGSRSANQSDYVTKSYQII
jgi:hypothetical protein